MTANTRKFYLYPEKLIPRESIAIETDRLEKEIRSLLNDKSKPSDQKVSLLETLINTKRSLHDMQGENRNIVVETLRDEPIQDVTATVDEEPSTVTEVTPAAEETTEQQQETLTQNETEEGVQLDVLHYIEQFNTEPVKYRSARYILTELLENEKFGVSHTEEIVINGKTIGQSSIYDILRDLVTAKKFYTPPPSGVREIVNFAKKESMEGVLEAIRNKWRKNERIKRSLSTSSTLKGSGGFFANYRERKR